MIASIIKVFLLLSPILGILFEDIDLKNNYSILKEFATKSTEE